MRVTKEMVENAVKRLNAKLGRPEEPYRNVGTTDITPNAGNFHTNDGHGGMALYEMQANGGCRVVVERCPKADMFAAIGYIFIGMGMEERRANAE